MNLILSTCDRIQRTSKNLVSPIKTSQKMSCASARTSQPLRPLHKAWFKRSAGRFPQKNVVNPRINLTLGLIVNAHLWSYRGWCMALGLLSSAQKPCWFHFDESIYMYIYIYTWSDDTIQNNGRTESWTLLTFRLLQTSCGKSNHSPTVYFLGWWTTILEIGWTHQRA